MNHHIRKQHIRKQRDWVAILGGALKFTDEQIMAAYDIGVEIAKMENGIVTGATSGVPYAAVLGVKDAGGLAMGISPAATPEEHLNRYKKPLDELDFIVYTGTGYDCRSTFIVNSASACIFIGGEIGTLKEFTSAWMAGHQIIGILKGFGGITDQLEELSTYTKTDYHNRLVIETNPKKLVQRIVREIHKTKDNSKDLYTGSDETCQRIKRMTGNRN